MSVPGGGEYLPPIITELRGDNSDLLRAFAEAKAAQEAFAASAKKMSEEVHGSTKKSGKDVDDFTDLIVRRMREGETATAVLRRELKRTGDEVAELRRRMSREGANQGLYTEFKKASDELARMRKLAQQVAPELLQGMRSLGQRTGVEFAGAFSGAGGMLVPAIIAALVLASPVIAGVIGGAVVVGLGLGFAGIGAILAAVLLPRVQKAFGRVGADFKKMMTGALSGDFDNALIHALKVFQRYIPVFGKQLRRIFDSLAPVLEPLANALGEGIAGFLTSIANVMPQLMPALLAFIDTIPEVMQGVADFLVKVSEDGPALARFIYDAAHAIAEFLRGTGDVIAWLTSAYEWIVKLNDKFPFIGWKDQLEGLKIAAGAIGAFFVMVWDKIVGGAESVGSWFAELGSDIWSWLKGAGKAVGDWFSDVIDWFAELPGKVGKWLSELPGKIKSWFSKMGHTAAYEVGFMAGKVVAFFRELPGKVAEWAHRTWADVKSKFRSGVTDTSAAVQALPGQVAMYFSRMWTDITAWASRTWQSVTDWFGRTKRSITEHISSAIDSAIAFFRGLPGRAAAEWKKFKDRAGEFFKGAKDWLVDAGRNIVEGLIEGVTGAWDWAVGKIKSLGHDIVKGFNDAVGNKSPSWRMAEAGENLALGVQKGWQRAWRALKRTVGTTGVTITSTPAPGGAPRPAGAPPPGPGAGGAGGPLYADFYLDGQRFASAVTTPVQRRGERSGITGLGAPSTRIM